MNAAEYRHCPDCDAELQTIPRGGVEYRRCPWTVGVDWHPPKSRSSLLVPCGRPYTRKAWM